MPRAYPHIHPTGGFQHDDDPLPSKELYLGHPTSPGLRDGPAAPHRPTEIVADGVPGLPRLWPQEGSQGPGTPGPRPGAKSKKTVYNDLADGEG